MIRINTRPTARPLTGQSHWWGEADMPAWMPYPEATVTDADGDTWQEPLTFVCQLRCDELAALDTAGLLPHEGMLYFFAALDYFLGDLEAPLYPGMGLWPQDCFRVLYAPTCTDLHTHHVVNADGSPAHLPAEAITFAPAAPSSVDADLQSASPVAPLSVDADLQSASPEPADGLRLLGAPYIDDVREAMPGYLSLLQVDECDRWPLVLHDCGTLNFLIRPDDLRQWRWDRTACYLFSF